MWRTGVQVSNETVAVISKMASDGRTTQQIASKVKLSVNVVNWQMEKHGVKTNRSRKGTPKCYMGIVEYGEYASLPDNILFDHKKFTGI